MTRRSNEKEIVEGYGMIGIITTMQNQYMPCCCYVYRWWISQERVLDHNPIYFEYIWWNDNRLIKAINYDNIRIKEWSFVNEMHPSLCRLAVFLDGKRFLNSSSDCFCVWLRTLLYSESCWNCAIVSLCKSMVCYLCCEVVWFLFGEVESMVLFRLWETYR